jgi:trk system potassium uptake protein TrkA
MTEFQIPPESPVVGQTVEEADRFDSLTFAGVFRDGGGTIIPRGDTVIEAEDAVVVIGSPAHIREFSAEIAPEQDGPSDVVIVGGGEIGLQTARLLTERGFAPRLVEQDPDRARVLAERLPDTTVLENDATDREFLERENVGNADVVIAALENDQQNLLASLLAKRVGAERAIAVVDTAGFPDLFEAVGVDVAVSPRAATAAEITRFTRARHAENVAILEADEAEVLELKVTPDGDIADRTVRAVADDFPAHAVIGAIARDGHLVTPRGDTRIEAGDHLIVFGEPDKLERVADHV